MSLDACSRRMLARRLAAAGFALASAAAGCLPDQLELAADSGALADAAIDLDAPSDAAIEVDSGLPRDCHVACGEVCLGGAPSAACDSCMSKTCVAGFDRVAAAPGVMEMDKCSGPCSDYACYQTCCEAHPQPCDAYRLVDACACGFFYVNQCRSSCASLCDGGPPGAACEDCIKDTVCGIGWYDWRYASKTAEFLQCLECKGAACEQNCCAAFDTSCLMLDAVQKCVCE
ncbi:MAG: hypothetical protein HY898_32625 [Deltaproteobacteria bacterium]|nr:hypothetical protein [Deltaproteobacteria bacterium]